jgi:hypothetical protein
MSVDLLVPLPLKGGGGLHCPIVQGSMERTRRGQGRPRSSFLCGHWREGDLGEQGGAQRGRRAGGAQDGRDDLLGGGHTDGSNRGGAEQDS